MSESYEDLKKKTVAQLRELAKGLEHEALKGYATMHKADLLHAVCVALGLVEHAHHDVIGIDKASLKAKIAALKVHRASALEAHDSEQLRRVRRKIHRLKRRIRSATV